MPSTSPPVRRLLILGALLMMLVGSLLPARLTGYAGWLGDKLGFVLAPLSHPLHYAAAAVRHKVDPPPADAKILLDEWESAQRTDALIRSLQQDIAELRFQNRMLRNIHEQLGAEAGRYTFPTAGVIAQSADPASSIFRLNLGTKDGLAEGIPAVKGANLIGRITRAGRLTSSLQLITTPGTKLDAILTPKLAPLSAAASPDDVPCQLDAHEDGGFVTVVRAEAQIHDGMYARLVDSDWPKSVQGMIIGKVTSVAPVSDDPLGWKRVTIEPRLTLRYVGAVELIVPQSDRGN